MKDETENFPFDEREAQEERLLALLLGELNPEEAESLEVRISKDAYLQSLRERLENSLDLVEEAARGRSALDPDSLRLDPARRRELEELWIDKRPETEPENETEPVPFEVVAEDPMPEKSLFMRFLPMAATAILALGATGMIVRSLIQQAEHQDDMVLASENASLSGEERMVVGIVRKPSSGKYAESEKPVSTSRERRESFPEASTEDFEAAAYSEPEALALDKVSDALDLKIQTESREILSKRIAEDIEELNDELRTDGTDLARRLNRIRRGSDQDVDVVSSADDLDVAMEFSSRNGLPAGLVGSIVEAEELDKRTSSVSGGASALGAGLVVSPARARTSVGKAGSRKDIVVPARTLGEAGALALIADEDRVSAALSNAQHLDYKRTNLPKDQPVPTAEIIPDTFDGNEKAKGARVSEKDRSSLPAVVDGKPASRIALSVPSAGKIKESEDFDSTVREKEATKFASSAPFDPAGASNRNLAAMNRGNVIKDKSESKENQLNTPRPSIHQPAASSGAVIGEKGANKELLAFAEFGLDAPVSDAEQKKSPIGKEIKGKFDEKPSGSEGPQEHAFVKSDAEGVASNSIVKVESPTDGTIENSTEQIASVEGEAATVDSTRGMGLALIFALLALVCLALVLLLYFRKRNS